MKNKMIVAALLLAITIGTAACSQDNLVDSPQVGPVNATPSQEETNAEWTREGIFEDEAGAMLMVYRSETEGYEGWSVAYYTEEEQHGWIIQQKGDKLYGNLTSGYEEPAQEDFFVTVKEDGSDGLLLVTPDAKEHHFTPADIPETIGTLTINIEGFGEIAHAEEGEELAFDDEHPFQSAVVNYAEPTTYQIAARPDKGYHFVKWTLNGEDYSEEDTITIDAEGGDLEFIAVFEMDE